MQIWCGMVWSSLRCGDLGCSIHTSAPSKLAGWGPSSLLEAMFVDTGGTTPLITQLTPRSFVFSLSPICSTDELYIWVDQRYGDMEDTFGITQAW